MKRQSILILHQNFPGQFPHIADAAAAAGYRVVAIGGPTAKNRGGIDVRRWKLEKGTTPGMFDHAIKAEADLLRAQAAARIAWGLKAEGFVPDLIICHPGWGENIHMKEVFPDTPQILLGEFYYKSHGADVAFDPEFEANSPEADMRVNAKNATMTFAYSFGDVIVCPTAFQASTFPALFQPKIKVLHEGVDIRKARKRDGATFKLPNGKILDGSKPVITFINRNFERLRGFHIFMRALPVFQARCPDADIIIIGNEDGKGYGSELGNGLTWKKKMLDEVGERIDLSRVHFVGSVEHSRMIDAMSISWGHVYYTYPFVLSWSLVEAMSTQCLIIGSDTPPVRDAIAHGVTGVLNDFFDVDALANAMADACETPERFAPLRAAARDAALAMFDRETIGVPGWMALIKQVIAQSNA